MKLQTNNFFILRARNTVYRLLARFDHMLGRKNQVIVLCYHSFAADDWRFTVSLAAFKKQMAYLKKHYQIIPAETFAEIIAGKQEVRKPSVLITIDDGYKDNISIVDYCQKNGIKPLLFVLAEPGETNYIETETSRPMLTETDLTKLQNAGWTIGCHSATHADFSRLSKAERNREIIAAKAILEKQLQCPIDYFAYPKGIYNNDIVASVKKAGYRLGFSMDDGLLTKKINKYTIPRIGVDRTHSFEQFTTLFSPSTVAFRRFIKTLPGVAIT